MKWIVKIRFDEGGAVMLFKKFKQGINLGGFLSQYEIVADLSSEETKK